jgi:hypothetical protein
MNRMNELAGYTWNDKELTYAPPPGSKVCDNCQFCRTPPADIVEDQTGSAVGLFFTPHRRLCGYTLPPWQSVLPSDWCRFWRMKEAAAA